MRCEYKDCLNKQPCYNYQGEKKRIFCFNHKKEGMVNVKHKRCEEEGCNSIGPGFNYPEQIKGIFCFNHKKEGMVNVKHKRCEEEGCNSIGPSFNYPNEAKGIFCFNHKKEGMVNVKHKGCEREDCSTSPSFNYPNEAKGIYCSSHKLEGMVNVLCRRCERQGCNLQPSFNYPTEIKVRFCNTHKTEGMINVNVKLKCKYKGCNSITPSFNYPNKIRGLFCGSHKLEGMVDVIHKRCERAGCSTSPSFNYSNEAKGIYCFNHKLEGMVDIKHKRCVMCENYASFGYPGNPVSFCSTCKKDGTIRNPRKKCTTEKCKEMALYGYRAQIACEKHKSPDMTNLVEKECKNCHLIYVVSPDGFCENCSDDWVGIVRKKKEYEVKHFLDTNHFSYISHDKKIQHSSLLSRPDFLFLSNNGKYYVVLEVDEIQHTFNKEECECVRMVNISQELGKPTIFIRYNPDEYKVGKKKYNPSLIERQKNLKVWLNGALSKSEEDIQNFGYLCFVQLYYDGYMKGNGKYETILGWD